MYPCLHPDHMSPQYSEQQRREFQSIVNGARLVIFALAFVALLWDAATSFNDIPNYVDSVSGVAKRLGWVSPVLPFAYFGLGVHFWINYDGYVWGWPTDLLVLLGLHPVVWLVAYLTRPHWYGTDDGTLFVMVASGVLGMVAYGVLFPQRPPSLDEWWWRKRSR